jgi:hypothetical protein
MSLTLFDADRVVIGVPVFNFKLGLVFDRCLLSSTAV